MIQLNILFFVLVLACAFSAVCRNNKVVVCYYGTWAAQRPGLGKFEVGNVDPFLCTHIIYAFVGIDTEGTIISIDPDTDFPDNENNFIKFTDLKKQNPNLKTLLAVGGWEEGSEKYSIMAANSTLRQNFIQSGLKMIFDYGFDGLDIDWEYPNRRDTVHGEADIDNFSQLLRETKEEFNKYGLLLTAAVSAVKYAVKLSYDVPTISKYLDHIHVMTYDMHGAWDGVTGHNAALHQGEGDEGRPRENLFTVDVAVEYWLSAGCPPEKLILGVPFFGHTFTLTDANNNGVRAPASGAGIAGPYSNSSGNILYGEFCVKLQTEPWTVRRDNLAKVPYAVSGVNWVSYDDPESIREKVEYANSMNLGGIMLWSIEADDFHNVCGGGEFTLLNTIKDALYGY